MQYIHIIGRSYNSTVSQDSKLLVKCIKIYARKASEVKSGGKRIIKSYEEHDSVCSWDLIKGTA